MTIETVYTIGDEVTHSGRTGTVAQIRVDVLPVGGEPTAQVSYKIIFGIKSETRLETELNGSTN